MNEDIAQKVFQQTIDFWVKPEIERRRKANRLPNHFNLRKAQIVFSLDKKPLVLLNDEVRTIIEVRVKRDVIKGENIYENDVDGIKSIRLPKKYPNCAHITLFLFRGKWVVAFDFRYNQKMIEAHIEASKEFYESAIDNLSKNRLRPFYENAFASAELSAKSILLMLPDKKILHGRRHKDRISKFDNWAKLGNVKMEFSTTLSKLNSLRDSARYLSSSKFKEDDTNNITSLLKEMLDFAEESIK